MREKTRDRAVRLMVGALLSSDLSQSELETVAAAFKEKDEDLLMPISALLHHATVGEPLSGGSGFGPSPSDLVETLDDLVEARGLTKAKMVDLIRSAANLPRWDPNMRWTRWRILESFVGATSMNNVQYVIDVLRGEPAEIDPFLEGISHRGRRRMGFGDKLRQKLDAPWADNISAMAQRESDCERVWDAVTLVAIWSSELQRVDSGNPALPFLRSGQMRALDSTALIGLALYVPAYPVTERLGPPDVAA